MTKTSTAFVLFLVWGLAHPALADQPKFGIDCTLVRLPQGAQLPGHLRGYRVDRVRCGSRAARIGLEPGDIIVSVDGFFFSNKRAFDWIMSGVGKTADVGVIDCRTGNLVRLKCRFNHERHKNRGRPPRGVAAMRGG